MISSPLLHFHPSTITLVPRSHIIYLSLTLLPITSRSYLKPINPKHFLFYVHIYCLRSSKSFIIMAANFPIKESSITTLENVGTPMTESLGVVQMVKESLEAVPDGPDLLLVEVEVEGADLYGTHTMHLPEY